MSYYEEEAVNINTIIILVVLFIGAIYFYGGWGLIGFLGLWGFFATMFG